MSRKNKTVVWLLLFIFLIVVFTSLATYAYFTAREYFYGGFDVEVTSKGVDTLSFTGNEDAFIEANVNNFAPGIGHDLTASANINVKLETTKPESGYCYAMAIKLPDEVIFEYSNGNVPELLLNVKKSQDGINYQNVITNMDITQKTGRIKIPSQESDNNYLNKINTTKNNTKIDYWQADITLVWFKNVDQTVNDNKTYEATLEAKRVECN
ncbi:MAG: hypothetical protein E7167_00990 [Firmicutes bacterium]|nr:hypothetical protein [Bacillota bacterium]